MPGDTLTVSPASEVEAGVLSTPVLRTYVLPLMAANDAGGHAPTETDFTRSFEVSL